MIFAPNLTPNLMMLSEIDANFTTNLNLGEEHQVQLLHHHLTSFAYNSMRSSPIGCLELRHPPVSSVGQNAQYHDETVKEKWQRENDK